MGSPGVTVVAVTEADLASLYLWLGQPARAQATLREPAADAPPTMQRAWCFATAQISSWLGRPAMPALERAYVWAGHDSGSFHRLVIECEIARCLPPVEGAPFALDALARSAAIGLELTTWPLKAVACEALRRCGRLDEACALARECVAHFDGRPPFVLYAPEYWAIAARAFEAVEENLAANAARARGVAWILGTGLPNVPAPFRDSYLHRNPVNRYLLAAGAGRPS
jgi:hypothetical protein